MKSSELSRMLAGYLKDNLYHYASIDQVYNEIDIDYHKLVDLIESFYEELP